MKEQKVITVQDTNELSIWLEEYSSSFEKGFWDYGIQIQAFCRYSYLRDAIFNSRIWGVMEVEDDEIAGVFLLWIGTISDECTAMKTETYLSGDIELFKFGINKIKKIFGKEYTKIKFCMMDEHKQENGSIIFQIEELKEEFSASLNIGTKKIYSYFL